MTEANQPPEDCGLTALLRLLSGESVTAVAMDCGYSTQGSMFLRDAGATPTDYLALNESALFIRCHDADQVALIVRFCEAFRMPAA
jgi:AraC-like DNA-binding protein